jgi:hypothetical protein
MNLKTEVPPFPNIEISANFDGENPVVTVRRG